MVIALLAAAAACFLLSLWVLHISTGAVESVMEFGSFVQVTLDRGEDGPHRHHTSYLMFPSAEWREPLARLATGDPITAQGEIERVTRVDMQIENCELVEDGC